MNHEYSVWFCGEFTHFTSHIARFTKTTVCLCSSYIVYILVIPVQVHSSLVLDTPELLLLTDKLLTEHKQTWTSLQHDLNMTACLLAYCKSAVL